MGCAGIRIKISNRPAGRQTRPSEKVQWSQKSASFWKQKFLVYMSRPHNSFWTMPIGLLRPVLICPIFSPYYSWKKLVVVKNWEGPTNFSWSLFRTRYEKIRTKNKDQFLLLRQNLVLNRDANGFLHKNLSSILQHPCRIYPLKFSQKQNKRTSL